MSDTVNFCLSLCSAEEMLAEEMSRTSNVCDFLKVFDNTNPK